MGLALIALSAPRLAAAFVDLPARPIIAAARSGAVIPSHLRAVATEARRSSLEWIWGGPAWADLGYLHLLEAQQSEDPAQAAEFDLALRAHRQALALSPGQAYAWTRMVYMELARNGPNRSAAIFLELGIRTAPNDRRLVFDRLDLALMLWRDLGGGQRELVMDQIRLTAVIGPGKLARLAKRRRAAAIIRAALAPGSALRDRFESIYARL